MFSFLRTRAFLSLFLGPGNSHSSSPSRVKPADTMLMKGTSHNPSSPQATAEKSMATEMDSCCPICLDSLKETSYIFPCLHQFCYTCILQWAENTPKCPLCKRRILSILHSKETENDYVDCPCVCDFEGCLRG
uniref:RING-type E3 ubiquitin transferase n=1 Tax=Geospiza parvula TaxID=87175 RepID=A0A8C3QEG0_GEOPR